MRSINITVYLISGLSIGLSGFLLYTAYFGTFYPYFQRSVPLTIAIVLAFLTLDAKGLKTRAKVPLHDWILVLVSVPVFGYAALYSDHLANRWPMSRMSVPSYLEITFGIMAVLLLMEAVRRTIGITLVLVVVLMLFYTLWGDLISWQAISHPGYSLIDAVDHYYLTMEGLWGSTLGIATSYVALFVIFGAFMEKSGATNFFVDLSNAIAGESRGGPAKVAIFASGFVGSVTGSTVANVYTTGQLSIPLMKSVGYRPSFAGAVEALASNGGQIMPPIMGAAAFLLASNAGVPYFTVVTASVIPALLYFGSLVWFIHLEAVKRDMKGLPKGSAPKIKDVLLRGGHLMIPLILLIVFLAQGYSPLLSGFYATASMVMLSWVRADTRIGPVKFIEALEEGAKSSVLIIVVCAAVGLVVGTFTLTGLGLTISSLIISVTNGNFILVLLMVTLAALVLGTGMNTVAAFILVSVAAVPAITAQGVDIFSANMFVFYVSLLSMITPPVCLAVFAGASIAGANIWETAFVAMRLGVVAYLLPFFMIFSPGILLIGSTFDIIIDLFSAAIAFFSVVCVFQNWMFGRINIVIRVSNIAGAILLMWPSLEFKAAGAALITVGIIILWLRKPKFEVREKH